MKTYDLIVLGVGMAGLNAAKKCASEGWTVAVVINFGALLFDES